MSGGDRRALTAVDVETLLDRLRTETPRGECRSCECLQGFLAQIQRDAPEEAKHLPAQRKVLPKSIHASLNCVPCLPARIFAEYLMRRQGER